MTAAHVVRIDNFRQEQFYLLVALKRSIRQRLHRADVRRAAVTVGQVVRIDSFRQEQLYLLVALKRAICQRLHQALNLRLIYQKL